MFKKNIKNKLLPFAVISSLALTSLASPFSAVEAKEKEQNNAEVKMLFS